MRCLFVLLCLVAGCIYPDTAARYLYQDVAERVVWHETYGMTSAPPPVTWVYNDVVAAVGEPAGITLPGSGIWVACRFPGSGQGPCNENIGITAYTHELFHWYCAVAHGNVDMAHADCDWNGLERRAEDALGKALEDTMRPCLDAATTEAQADQCQF